MHYYVCAQSIGFCTTVPRLTPCSKLLIGRGRRPGAPARRAARGPAAGAARWGPSPTAGTTAGASRRGVVAASEPLLSSAVYIYTHQWDDGPTRRDQTSEVA